VADALLVDIVDELEVAFAKLEHGDVGGRTDGERPEILERRDVPRRLIRHAADRLIERHSEHHELRHDRRQIEDAERLSRPGDVRRDRVGPEAVAGRRIDDRPRDVRGSAVADVEPHAAGARGSNVRLVETADFYGPLVDYREKGHTVEYLGHDTVDGDDVHRLKCTLKNGDVVYYYLDPDSSLEIRTERQQFIRGAVRERQTDLGSYKPVAGVMFPYSIETGPKNNPSVRAKVTIEGIEANVPIDDSAFKMPKPPVKGS